MAVPWEGCSRLQPLRVACPASAADGQAAPDGMLVRQVAHGCLTCNVACNPACCCADLRVPPEGAGGAEERSAPPLLPAGARAALGWAGHVTEQCMLLLLLLLLLLLHLQLLRMPVCCLH